MLIVSPSILACDFSKLGEEVKSMEAAGAQWLHIDIMDGHFVPNISMGPCVVKAIRPRTSALFDVHLMISDPIDYVDAFIDAGAELITFHLEANSKIEETISKIKSKGVKAGLSIKPRTPVDALYPYLDQIDLALVMTVEPGFGGQKFMADMMPKVSALKAQAANRNSGLFLQVDGGIDNHTVSQAVAAGANVLVAGSALFGKPDAKAAVKELLKNAVKPM